jgi:hypothetical protein
MVKYLEKCLLSMLLIFRFSIEDYITFNWHIKKFFSLIV